MELSKKELEIINKLIDNPKYAGSFSQQFSKNLRGEMSCN